MPQHRLGRTASLAAATGLSAVLLLGGAAHAAEPPPFPPPGGIELNEKGEPKGEQIDTTWEIVKPFKAAAEWMVHGAFDIASGFWNTFFPGTAADATPKSPSDASDPSGTAPTSPKEQP
ncbi:hypothetical protein AB0B50_12735 [Streptomyces sp. NPDC041068]|uniref:hypothetical protein n=1 Tax=Streptomyces sp. NPDC041068 TaxID=3155130 RepID=UPI0033D1B43D